MMTIPSHIFRAYDIRGIVGEELTVQLVRRIGEAFGVELHERPSEPGMRSGPPVVVVGQDNRPSSPELAESLIDGLRQAAVDVTDLGTVPTPVTYWAEHELGAQAAIQITGSHNPPEWNGIKLSRGKLPFHGAAIQRLLGRILEGKAGSGDGAKQTVHVLERYVEDVAGRFQLARPVKVAVDCGNGTASVVAVTLLEALGAEVVPIYCESDGTFPNHHPDPSVDANLDELRRLVQSTGSEVGIAFDGDADRLGVVDETGRIIRGDILLLVFGLDLIARRGPGHLLLYDVKCSQVVPEVYDAAGGRSMMWKTGHSHMKEKMKETGAVIAGELSGHVCFADDYLGIDDALYGACRLLDILARSEHGLSEAVATLPQRVSTPELRVEIGEARKTRVVEAAAKHFSARYPVADVDGVRILFENGWALLRASNTQPVLVARFEAHTPEALAEIRDEVTGWLKVEGVDV